jgi:hypothetical protein
MNEALDAPDSEDDLYEERKDVGLARPVMQGDVFDGVPVPAFGSEPSCVQVVMHPCSMREGIPLRERVTVALVQEYRQKITSAVWGRHGNVMPLPSLRLDDTPYVADLREVSSVNSSELTRSYGHFGDRFAA